MTITIRHSELRGAIGSTAACPHCAAMHDVNALERTAARDAQLHFVRCPVDGDVYLVGVNGLVFTKATQAKISLAEITSDTRRRPRA